MTNLERAMENLANTLRHSIALSVEEQELVLSAIVAYKNTDKKVLQDGLILKFKTMITKNKA